MNRGLATIIPAAILLASAGTSIGMAQEAGTAVVPFSFHVNSQTLAAGKYQVKQFESGGRGPVLTIANTQGKSVFATSQSQTAGSPDNPKLTFACHSGDCTLKSVSLPGSEVTYEMFRRKSAYQLGMATLVKIGVAR